MKKLYIMLLLAQVPSPLLCQPCQYFFPLNAIVALQTDQLKRSLSMGDPQQPSTQLLGHLFKIEDNRLYPQNNLSRPAAHFNPKIIADLITALEKKTLLDPSYTQTWEPALLKTINSELKKNSKGSMTVTKLNAFLETLKNTTNPSLPSTALFGYLCLKYKSDDALTDFFKCLKINGIDSEPITHLSTILKGQCTPKNQQEFETKIKKVASEHSSDDIIHIIKGDRTFYQAALCTQIDAAYYRASLPPMAKESDVIFDGISVRDCVDTALRTFFDHLFYDRETWCFNPLKKLPPTVKIYPELMSFYKKYYQPLDVNGSATIAHDWMTLLANRPNIIYRYTPPGGQRFVVRAFLCNIIEILNQLCSTTGKTGQELCALLSTEQQTLHCTYEKNGKKDIMHIAIEQKGQEPFILSLETTAEHGFMRRNKKQLSTHVNTFEKNVQQALLDKLSTHGYDYDDHTLLSVYLNQDPADLKDSIKRYITDKNISYENLLDFYSLIDFDPRGKTVEGIDRIVFKSVCSKLRQYPALKSLLQKLITELHDADTFYYYYYIKYLARYQLWTVDKEFIDVIIKLLRDIKNENYAHKAIAVLMKNHADEMPALAEVITHT